MKKNLDTILYVVVLYNQILKKTNIYKSLLNRIPAHQIFVWDNSTTNRLNSDLYSYGIQYVYSQQNMGVSFPYNRAFDFASQKGFQWIMLLDQDTTFADTFLGIVESAIHQYPEIKIFCPLHQLSGGSYLSPAKFFMKFTRPTHKKVLGIINVSKYAIINSGLLVDVATFRRAGGYNEKVFLDYSDFQFLDRLAKFDSKAFCLSSVCLQDFSNDCMENDKVLKRFTLFCQSLKGCEHNGAWEAIEYHLVVLKRCLSLIYRLKSFQPFITYYKYYIK
nr:glycosyltransferase [Bacteroides intestinalis]